MEISYSLSRESPISLPETCACFFCLRQAQWLSMELRQGSWKQPPQDVARDDLSLRRKPE